jgi:glycosyltransferase involved in cell wall biosynthesis
VPRSVLNVLPHPGGGGETYVDALAELEDFQSHRLFLSSRASPSPKVVRGVARVARGSSSYDLVHLHGEVVAGLCLPVIRSVPAVVTFNGLHLVGRLDGIRYAAARRNLRAVVGRADATICVSRSEFVGLVTHLGADPGTRARVVPNGVAWVDAPTVEERDAARGRLGIDRSVVALFAGSLDRRKDPVTPAVATAALEGSTPELVLLVAGDGPLKPTLDDLARRTPNVRVLGHRSDISALMAISDIFVLVSEREGLSFALLEAMANGCAPIVTDIPANVEAVGTEGLFVPYADVRSFTAAFRRLLSDPAAVSGLGAGARARDRSMFSQRAMVEATHAVYEDVLRNRSPGRRVSPRSTAH